MEEEGYLKGVGVDIFQLLIYILVTLPFTKSGVRTTCMWVELGTTMLAVLEAVLHSMTTLGGVIHQRGGPGLHI